MQQAVLNYDAKSPVLQPLIVCLLSGSLPLNKCTDSEWHFQL